METLDELSTVLNRTRQLFTVSTELEDDDLKWRLVLMSPDTSNNSPDAKDRRIARDDDIQQWLERKARVIALDKYWRMLQHLDEQVKLPLLEVDGKKRDDVDNTQFEQIAFQGSKDKAFLDDKVKEQTPKLVTKFNAHLSWYTKMLQLNEDMAKMGTKPSQQKSTPICAAKFERLKEATKVNCVPALNNGWQPSKTRHVSMRTN